MTTHTPAGLTKMLAARVGHDGTDNLRIIVDHALADNPDTTLDELVEIVLQARSDASYV